MKAIETRRPLAPVSLLAAAIMIALLPVGAAGAQTVDWTGSTGFDWDTPSNWDTNSVPAAGDEAVVDDVSVNTAQIGSAVNAQVDAIRVGDLGKGILHILNAGTLTTTAPSFIGWAPGSEGLVSVAGLNATWTSGDTIILGYQGHGSLIIDFTGQVQNNGTAALGFLEGAKGYALVQGAGSSWSNTGNLVVGVQGSGQINVYDQAQLSSDEAYLGGEAGSGGAVNLSGAGSQWTNAQGLYVGHRGFGSMKVLKGATVSSGFGIVGNEAGATGSVTVEGAGSAWLSGNGLVVGHKGAGALAVTGGATVASGMGFVGQEAGSTGQVTVSGANSAWTNTSILQVGGAGSGSLVVEDGGAVTAGLQAQIGQAEGGSGSVDVSLATLDVNGNLFVGVRGNGTLTVRNGAVTSSNGSVGTFAGGSGSVLLDDAASWLLTSALNVADEGAGELMLDGGSFLQSAAGYIGTSAGGVGSVSVAGGSTWDVAGDFHVGSLGDGTLLVRDGGMVDGTAGTIGSGAGSTGQATVEGTGSSWTMTGSLFVGNDGEAALVVADGGTVSNATAYIAADASASGTATVTGAGSTWNSSGGLGVGVSGSGSLTIADGGTVNSGAGSIAGNAGSSGIATVTGQDSAWNSAGLLHVGFDGAGELVVTDGATVSDAGASLGGNTGAQGIVTVAGAGSTWTHGGNLVVGAAGDGELTITDGAVVHVGGDTTQVAALAGSTGTLNIGSGAGEAAAAPGILDSAFIAFGAGDGSVVFNHSADAYVFGSSFHGPGTIAHHAGTTLLAGDSGSFNGTTELFGGTLVVNGTLGGALTAHDGTTLGGSGTVGTTTIGSGATIAPGNSIGTLVVDGNYVQAAGSTYALEVDAAGNSDLVDVTGSAQLDGGTVQVTFLGEAPSMDVPYTILAAAGGVSGTFSAMETTVQSTLFLAPTLDYDSNNVYFMLAQSLGFADVAQSPNQVAAASAADGLGPGNVMWDAISQLGDEADARAAFDALSGEIHASLGTALVENSQFMREAVNGQLHAAAVAGNPRGTVAWVQAHGSTGHVDGDGNAARVGGSTGELFVGADTGLGGSWRAGIALGQGGFSFDIHERVSSVEVDTDSLAAYAGGRLANLDVRLGAATHRHDVETRRSVAFPGFAAVAAGSYDVQALQVFVEAAYPIHVGAARVEPFAGVAHVKLDADGYGEGGDAGLEGEGVEADGVFSTLGLRAVKTFGMQQPRAVLHGSIAWRHASGFGDMAARHRFAAGGDVFQVAGVPVAKDLAVVEAGLDLKLTGRASLLLSYRARLGGGFVEHDAGARFSIRF